MDVVERYFYKSVFVQWKQTKDGQILNHLVSKLRM